MKALAVLAFVSLSTALAASPSTLLGTKNPFSKSAVCQQFACVVSGNADVAGYRFITYARTTDQGGYVETPGSGGFFVFQKGGVNVAIGIFGIGTQATTTVGDVKDVELLMTLSGRSGGIPAGALVASEVDQTPLVMLDRSRNVTFPLGGRVVLTNSSQRNRVKISNASRGAIREIDVAYIALSAEVPRISRLINRWAPAEEAATRRAFMAAQHLKSSCPMRDAQGNTMSFDRFPQKAWTSWLVARGFGVNSNTGYLAFPLPGLAQSSVVVTADHAVDMEALVSSPLCVH